MHHWTIKPVKSGILIVRLVRPAVQVFAAVRSDGRPARAALQSLSLVKEARQPQRVTGARQLTSHLKLEAYPDHG
jgi:hypothetical protein